MEIDIERLVSALAEIKRRRARPPSERSAMISKEYIPLRNRKNEMSGRINGEMTVMHGRVHNIRRFPYDKIRITHVRRQQLLWRNDFYALQDTVLL